MVGRTQYAGILSRKRMEIVSRQSVVRFPFLAVARRKGEASLRATFTFHNNAMFF
jgi:hypothetical protein